MARVSVLVTVRDATREGLRRVRNSVNGLNRGILQTLSATFSDGVGQALALGFQKAMSNPYVAAAVVALAAVVAIALGAALGGALTLAFGGAFIALGVMAIKNAKEVKEAFSRELKSVKAAFKDASKPLIPVAVHAAELFGKAGRAFAPHFKAAMEESAPVLKGFLDKVSEGLKTFGKEGFRPMMTGFNDLLSSINWKGFFNDLTDSFGNLGRAISENKRQMGSLFDAILGLIPKAINLLAWFVRAWGAIEEPVSAIWNLLKASLTPAFEIFGLILKGIVDLFVAISPLIQGFADVLTHAWGVIKGLGSDLASFFGPIWQGFIDGIHDGSEALMTGLVPVLQDFYTILGETVRGVLGVFLPGLDDMATKGQTAGQTIRDWINNSLAWLGQWLTDHREDIAEWMRKGSEAVIGFARWIKETAIPALMEFGAWLWEKRWVLALALTGIQFIIDAIRWAGVLWGWVKRAWEIFLHVSGIRLVLDLIGAVQRLWGWVQRNWNRSVVFRMSGITGIINTVKTLWGWVSRNWRRVVSFSFTMSGPVGTIKKLLGLAHGGVRGLSTAATGGVRNNLTLVGEQGPELVDMAPGSRVRSNPDSRRIMRNAGARGGAATLLFKSSGRRVDDLLLEILREAIHQRGGDPIAVLGG